MKIPRGLPCWHDLVTPDLPAALGFYGELFAWQTREVDMGGGMKYTILEAGDRDVGGAMSTPPGLPPGPATWHAYFTTVDTDATAALVRELGGAVVAEPHDIPAVGRFAMFTDPAGAGFAVLEPLPPEDPPPDGPPALGQFCWDEAQVDGPDALLSFYGKVFGWTATNNGHEGHGRYHMLSRAEGDHGRAAGLTARMTDGPNAWISYVAVDDVDAALARAVRLRAVVLFPVMTVPGAGGFAILQDPGGATFGIFQRP